jgi:hypothetical protein
MAELLVDERPGRGRVRPPRDRLLESLEDQLLGVGDPVGLFGGGLGLDAEPLLLERAAVVEGEDEKAIRVDDASLFCVSILRSRGRARS